MLWSNVALTMQSRTKKDSVTRRRGDSRLADKPAALGTIDQGLGGGGGAPG
jgi:hypothetical protein